MNTTTSQTRWRTVAALMCVLALSFLAPAHAQVPVPQLRSPVTDLTNTLTGEQVSLLDQKLRAFEQRKGSQVAVLLVPTTQPEAIEQFSIRVVEAWKLGRANVDDGVLLIVAKDDRAVRIEVGYGVEGALPDVIANRIIEQVIVPRFRNGQYYEGVNEATDRITAVLDGEPLPEAPAPRSRSRSSGSFESVLPIMLMVIFVGSGILRRMLGGFGGAAVTAGIAGVLVWLLTSVLVISLGAAIIAFLVALFGGGGGGPGGLTGRRRRSGWGGGLGSGWGGGGWSSGGGGFGGGGWSGGGGGFGGGGASGRW